MAKLAGPTSSGIFNGYIVRVTIGDLFKAVPMIISSLSYSWDSEYPWELDGLTAKDSLTAKAPKYTDVSISLSVLRDTSAFTYSISTDE